MAPSFNPVCAVTCKDENITDTINRNFFIF
jgi:hypothetical protein